MAKLKICHFQDDNVSKEDRKDKFVLDLPVSDIAQILSVEMRVGPLDIVTVSQFVLYC